MDLKIVGWTDYDSAFPTLTVPDEEIGDMIKIVVDEIVNGGYVFSGEEHQNSATGVPVFSNGTCFRASMRAWGSMMTYAYPLIDGKPSEYMDFYMSVPDTSVLPEETDIDITPADSDNFHGLVIQEDHDLISQSIEYNISLMTLDKAINDIIETIKSMQESEEDDEE